MTNTATVRDGLRDNPIRLLVFVRSLFVAGLAIVFLIHLDWRFAGSAPGPSSSARSLQTLLWSLPLVLGLVAEFTSFRAARLINLGFYVFCSAYPSISFALGAAGVLGFMAFSRGELVDANILFALPSAVLAAALFVLYSFTTPARLSASDAA